jgi:hypothetical protein
MNAKLKLDGLYTVQGRKLFSTDKPFYLILQERKNQGNKPLQFIVAKCPSCTFTDTGKPDQYISSVFGSGRIEYQGINYTLSIHGDQAVISQSAMNNKGTLYP